MNHRISKVLGAPVIGCSKHLFQAPINMKQELGAKMHITSISPHKLSIQGDPIVAKVRVNATILPWNTLHHSETCQ